MDISPSPHDTLALAEQWLAIARASGVGPRGYAVMAVAEAFAAHRLPSTLILDTLISGGSQETVALLMLGDAYLDDNGPTGLSEARDRVIPLFSAWEKLGGSWVRSTRQEYRLQDTPDLMEARQRIQERDGEDPAWENARARVAAEAAHHFLQYQVPETERPHRGPRL